MESPPEYERVQGEIKKKLNKKIIHNLIDILTNIADIDTKGVTHLHDNLIRQLMKGFDKNHLYDEFPNDYEFILKKLTSCMTESNNFALRSIHEALEIKDCEIILKKLTSCITDSNNFVLKSINEALESRN